jgi:hypothetical protein
MKKGYFGELRGYHDEKIKAHEAGYTIRSA